MYVYPANPCVLPHFPPAKTKPSFKEALTALSIRVQHVESADISPAYSAKMHAFDASNHAQTFLFTFYAGFFSCWLYDALIPLYRHLPSVLRLLFDCMLATFVAFTLFLSIMLSGADCVRFHTIVALTLGAAIYKLGLSSCIRKIFSRFASKRKSHKHGE